MPGWRALDDIMKDVRQEIGARPAPVPTDRDRLREGVMNLFEPVIAVIQKLHDAGSLVRYGVTGEAFRDFDADDLRQNLRSMPNPIVIFHLDAHTSFSVRIAIRPDLPYPDNITTAKWRCIAAVSGDERDNQLYDNRDMMARWVLTQVLSFVPRPIAQPFTPVVSISPPVRSPTDPAPPAPAREHRVIMVDDPEE